MQQNILITCTGNNIYAVITLKIGIDMPAQTALAGSKIDLFKFEVKYGKERK